MAKKKNKELLLNGYVEIWGEVKELTLMLYESGGFGIWISNDLYDGVSTIEEFLEQVKDIAYSSLEDYRSGENAITISKWIKETGWTYKEED